MLMNEIIISQRKQFKVVQTVNKDFHFLRYAIRSYLAKIKISHWYDSYTSNCSASVMNMIDAQRILLQWY